MHTLLSLLGICAVFVGFVVAIVTPVLVSDFVKKIRRSRRESRLFYQQHRAEQDIRNIRRNAAQEMLRAEREYRHAYGDGEIIEGTAVEVRR
jgi:hypothetical protein